MCSGEGFALAWWQRYQRGPNPVCCCFVQVQHWLLQLALELESRLIQDRNQVRSGQWILPAVPEEARPSGSHGVLFAGGWWWWEEGLPVLRCSPLLRCCKKVCESLASKDGSVLERCRAKAGP